MFADWTADVEGRGVTWEANTKILQWLLNALS